MPSECEGRAVIAASGLALTSDDVRELRLADQRPLVVETSAALGVDIHLL